MNQRALGLFKKIKTGVYEGTRVRHGGRRLLNTALAKLQKKLGTTHLLGLPYSVILEVTNICNCNCQLCPVGQRRVKRKPGRMSWERFVAIVDKLDKYVRLIDLFQWGDPFLHPAIYKMISHISEKHIYLRVSSTLRNWSEEEAEQLVMSGLDQLAVSIHGVSEETYRAYQPRFSDTCISIEDVLVKVGAIAAMKRKRGATSFQLILKFVVNRKNEHEIDKLPDLANRLGVDYILTSPSLNLRFLPFDAAMKPRDVDEEALRKERLAVIDEWLPRNRRYVNSYYHYIREHKGMLPPVNPKWVECTYPWDQMYISWDGDVNLCCGSYDPDNGVGNIMEQPLRKIWNNPAYRDARRHLLDPSLRPESRTLCHECLGSLI